jgi:hypothetical protein
MREFSETEQLNKYLPRSKGMENKRMIWKNQKQCRN